MSDFFPAYFSTRFYVGSDEYVFPERGVILSAYATTGEVWSSERNREADKHLEAFIESEVPGVVVRLIGYSPIDHHAEPCWLVEVDCSKGCEIGVCYKQDAIYAVEAGAIYVVDCQEPDRRAFVGDFFERLDRLEPEAMRKRLESY